MGSPQLPSFGKDDMAKQIRAKFENLVRASPLPKVNSHCVPSIATCCCLPFVIGQACLQAIVQVVEQFVSPRGIQQTDWSSKFSRDANRVSSWHARLTPASNQSESGTSWSDKPVVGHIGHNEAAAGTSIDSAEVTCRCMQSAGAMHVGW